MTRTRIDELLSRVGEQVSIRGWVQVVRDQKRMQFLVIRDESGSAQAILAKEDPPTDLNEEISRLAAESAVTVTGTVVADERVKLGGLELQLAGLTVDSPAEPRAADRARFGLGQADRLALSRFAPPRSTADLRGAEHGRARDARVLA